LSRRRFHEPARRILSQSRLPCKGTLRRRAHPHVHARTPPRYRCLICGKTFGARAGTPFYRRHTDEATITTVLTLLAHGCPLAAVVIAFGVRRQTVSDWLDAAGQQGGEVHQHLVLVPRDLGQVPRRRTAGQTAGGRGLDGDGDDRLDAVVAGRGGQSAPRWRADPSPDAARPCRRLAGANPAVRGRLCGIRGGVSDDYPHPCAAHGTTGATPDCSRGRGW